MKKYILTSLLLSSGLFSIGQSNQDHASRLCGSTEQTEIFKSRLKPSDYERWESSRLDLEQQTQLYIQNNPHVTTHEDRSVDYTIPVVFHVLYNNENENISDDQIHDQVNLLNLHFQKLNADTMDVVSTFIPIIADVQIEFKLATLDPMGNCTQGITRTNTTAATDPSATEADRINAVVAAHGIWPGNKYLNIYVTGSIGSGAAGYTYKPDNVHGSNMTNGIHILHNYVGSIGTSSDHSSRALTHEIGHWLNLSHTWGGTNSPADAVNCNADDGVIDTPPTIGWTSCDLAGTTCGTDLDNVQNYMEYSYCSRMFTLGQKARMHAALNSSVGGRSNIWSANNLMATGVDTAPSLCHADFEVDKRVICPGETVSFSDLSFSNPSTWQWSFPGASPSTSTQQNPSVTYINPGWYNVSLTVSDASNSEMETKSGYIYVMDGLTYPFSESFEMNLDSNVWWVINEDDNYAFQVSNQNSYTGTQCLWLNNYNQNGSYVDGIVLSTLDMSGVNTSEAVSFTMRLANAKRTDSDLERLRIYFSKDCGESWDLMKTIFGANLSNVVEGSAWFPTSQNDWKSVYIENISSTYFVEGFRVKIEFESDAGNNLFIDDINVFTGNASNDPVGANDLGLNMKLWLNPNPSVSIVTVCFEDVLDENLRLELYNTMGELIDAKVKKASVTEVRFDDRVLSPGIYYVKVRNSKGNYRVLKAVVES